MIDSHEQTNADGEHEVDGGIGFTETDVVDTDDEVDEGAKG